MLCAAFNYTAENTNKLAVRLTARHLQLFVFAQNAYNTAHLHLRGRILHLRNKKCHRLYTYEISLWRYIYSSTRNTMGIIPEGQYVRCMLYAGGKVRKGYKILIAFMKDGNILKISATFNFSINICSMKVAEMPGYSVKNRVYSYNLQNTKYQYCRLYTENNDCPLVYLESEGKRRFNPYPANLDNMASSYQC